MSALFPGTTEHRVKTRGAEIFDLAADEADRAAGRRIGCPTLALWGTSGIASEASGPLGTWREWCVSVEGAGVDAGHFIAEENPADTLAHLLPFLTKTF